MKINKKIIFTILFLFLCVIIAILLFCLEYKQEKVWICSVCGSMKKQSTYISFINTPLIMTPSPLDKWLEQKGIEHLHDWIKVEGTGKTIAGMAVRHSHGRAPAIYFFEYDIMKIYISHVADEEIMSFLETMKAGTEEGKRKCVEAATESAIGSLKK